MLPLVGDPVPAHLPIRRPTLEAQAVEEANTTSLRPADIRADPVDLGRPLYRDANLPVGTALVGAWSDCDIYIGSEFRIDVSSEAGSRFDQNVTGFRGEEEFGFNAEPYVRTGKFVKILGL